MGEGGGGTRNTYIIRNGVAYQMFYILGTLNRSSTLHGVPSYSLQFHVYVFACGFYAVFNVSRFISRF